MLRFEDPTWLSVLWLLLLIPAIGWFSSVLRSRRWRVPCVCIRTIIIAAVIVALARPIREHVEQQRLPAAVVALQDVSESVAADASEAGELWSRYQDALPDGVECKAAAFADQVAPLDQPMTIDSGETDIESAIDWAIEQLGPNANGHILLLSDGRSTRGEPLPAAARAAEAGLRLHTIPVGEQRTHAPRIVAVTPPEDARVGTTSHALVRVRADRPTDARLTLVDGDGIEAARLDTGVSGDGVVGLPLKPTRKGLHAWSVLLQTDKGGDVPVDAADLGFDVAGPPQVLLCDPEPLSLGALQQVLRQLQFEHRVVTPAEFPDSREALAAYDAVVLSDWREPSLNEAHLVLLQQYVNRGGGLVFIGGTRVSTKKWHGSPLERLLPIDFAPQPVREKQRLKPVHVCYVLDVSGSM
ncbi:MAG: VWA domain-containing protein, partial [Planctomycetes bacterium]|nr:VWA domain-containing protein [Planctomycetota bacterium]